METEEHNQMHASNLATLEEKVGDFSLKFPTENYPVIETGKRIDNQQYHTAHNAWPLIDIGLQRGNISFWSHR